MTSIFVMLRMVVEASRRASLAASPQDWSDTPSSSKVFTTGKVVLSAG